MVVRSKLVKKGVEHSIGWDSEVTCNRHHIRSNCDRCQGEGLMMVVVAMAKQKMAPRLIVSKSRDNRIGIHWTWSSTPLIIANNNGRTTLLLVMT